MSAKYLSIIKNQIQTPAPPVFAIVLGAAQGFELNDLTINDLTVKW
jgi:hypothetical protein